MIPIFLLILDDSLFYQAPGNFDVENFASPIINSTYLLLKINLSYISFSVSILFSSVLFTIFVALVLLSFHNKMD